MNTGVVVNLQTGLPEFRRSVWCEFSGTISASSSLTIDTLPLADFSRLKYEITFTGSTDDDVRSLTMSVQKKDSDIKEVVFNKQGPMKIDLDTIINGSSFELEATNPETFDVDYCLTVLTS